LSDRELDWLNDYHKDVAAKLSNGVDDPAVLAWLEIATAPLER
jgi:hypothetical protein